MLPAKCEGCANATNVYFVFNAGCTKLERPDLQHSRVGGCHFRSHNLTIIKDENAKPGWVDPLKASKKAAKGMASKPSAKKSERRDR